MAFHLPVGYMPGEVFRAPRLTAEVKCHNTIALRDGIKQAPAFIGDGFLYVLAFTALGQRQFEQLELA